MDAITSSGNFLGTDRIGRPLTDAESKALGALLREHGFRRASLVALRFAWKKTGSEQAARDLMGRTWLRFVRWGWDPNAVTLVKRLCRLVWSEWTHQLEETEKARIAEEAFIAEQVASGELVLPAPSALQRGDPLHRKKELAAPSYEQQVERLNTEREEDARREKKLEQMRAGLSKLRATLEAKGDAVNVEWLDLRLKGIEDPKDMAQQTQRRPEEFYAATKRRARVVRDVLAEVTGGRDVRNDEDGEKSR